MDLHDRVRRLAATANDLSSVRAGLDAVLRQGVAYDASAISTVDPATLLWTSCYISGLPAGGEEERERLLYSIEFEADDINPYSELSNSGRLVARLHRDTGGDLTLARRYRELLRDLGVCDEMRVVLANRGMVWGTLALYRVGSRSPFSDRDEEIVRSAIAAMADLFRFAMLRAAVDHPGGLDRPPGMLVVAPDGRITASSPSADRWLETIDDRGRVPSVVRSVAAAAAADSALAHAALPTPGGPWVMLHASPMAGESGIGVIVEEARPAILSEVIAAAHGLTAREREVTALASQGRSNKQIAQELRLSVFTVQDHLKSVFSKIGAQSRAELVAALYVRHYEPRRQAGATPSPYGWYLDDAAIA